MSTRSLAIVLHTHLPWVLHHGSWPHGEDWLMEATTHCYLPLVEMLQRRAAAGARSQLTVTLSPVLVAAWRHPSFPAKLLAYLAAREQAAKTADTPLGDFWRELFARRQELFLALQQDLAGAFAALAQKGVVELGTCAATHAYLPLVHDVRSARLSLQLAQAYHQRVFGQPASGVWLPECAYRPAGPFRHPVTGAWESFRPGIDELLQEAGFAWTVLDAHLLLGGRPVASSAARGPEVRGPVQASLYHPARIARSSVAAFFRDPHTSLQVWSREHGYPGEARYLDFHKRHWPTGLKLWRVTHPKADLADKQPYQPEKVDSAVDAHAHHFLEVVAGIAEAAGGVVVAPFDTELFGHWWFEGVAFLEAVLQKASQHPWVRTTTLTQALAGEDPAPVSLPEGSWGEGGDHRVWVNPDTESFWWELEKLERQAWRLLAAGQGHDGFRSALAQELLLALASDWPFLVTTRSAADYAKARFSLHLSRSLQLMSGQLTELPPWVAEDAVFPDGLLLTVLDSVVASQVVG